jgi:hypothetical protein
MIERPEAGRLATDVSLRNLMWPHIPRIFARPSHLGSPIALKSLFCCSEWPGPVGSIPIARSIPSHCWPMPANELGLECRAISWRTFAGVGCGFTRSLVRMAGFDPNESVMGGRTCALRQLVANDLPHLLGSDWLFGPRCCPSASLMSV